MEDVIKNEEIKDEVKNEDDTKDVNEIDVLKEELNTIKKETEELKNNLNSLNNAILNSERKSEIEDKSYNNMLKDIR